MSRLRALILVCVIAFCGHQLTSRAQAASSPDADQYPLATECLEALNRQVNDELFASLTYLNMAAHFGNTKVARKGFSKWFEHQSDEEKGHGHKMIHYINKRGGKVSTLNVPMPTKDTWSSARDAIGDAIALEKEVNNKLHVIHSTAEHVCKDPALMDFLEGEYLAEQIESIQQFSKMLTTLSSFGDGNEGLGEFLVDQQLLDKEERKTPYFDEL